VKQLDLFGLASEAEAPVEPEDRALAARLPAFLKLGTSTWTFPGWRGIFYPRVMSEREIVARGLGVYARNPLFRTVGVDRSFYAPLTDDELRRYRDDLPEGYGCAMKVWSAIVTRDDPRTGARIPTFLDPHVFAERVLRPIDQFFSKNLGVFLFVLSPMRALRADVSEVIEALDRFFERVPRSYRCAVELRNPELLTASYLEVLRRHGVGHVLGLWERMPTIRRQLLVPSVLSSPLVVCRLSIRPGDRYDERKRACAPFDKLVAVDEETRADVVELVRRCASERRELVVIVNNKVEGSAPLTVRGLARRIAEDLEKKSA